MTYHFEKMNDAAYELACRAHMGQKRKTGEPYITHPERVAAKANMYPDRAVAFLHGVIEDTDYTLKQLEEAGFPPIIIDAVDAITKRKDESYVTYLKRVAKNQIARRVKILDIEDNMNDNLGKGNLRQKYELALFILEERYDALL